MTPAELVRAVLAAGFRFNLAGGFRLITERPGAALPDDTLAELRAAREAVAAWLTCRGCGAQVDDRRRCWRCGFRPCAFCGKATGSVLIATCFPCGTRAA